MKRVHVKIIRSMFGPVLLFAAFIVPVAGLAAPANAADTTTSTVTVVDVPPASYKDPCNGPGVKYNSVWLRPATTSTFSWTIEPMGNLVVRILAADMTFPDGTRIYNYGMAPESGVKCSGGPKFVVT